MEDRIIAAFERMHEIYSLRDHDAVALFALQLARDFIECEAGSAMLITPGKYELYVAAAEGSVADKLMGKKLSLTQGIVGFAARAGAVVTVSDPENDPRFHVDFDKLSGFKTRSVVCSPIQYEGRTLGAIELINGMEDGGFRQSDANVLSYIAGAVGEYIDTSLPSREADFSDREFAEFVQQKRPPVGRRKPKSGAKSPASKKTSKKKPAKGKAAKPRTTKPPKSSAKLKKKRKR